MDIFGNPGSQAQILEAVRTDTGLRTVLLSGPSYVGKRAFILQTLKAYLEEPDLLSVDHSMAGARDASFFCSSAPVFSSYRAILVDGADQLSDAAQDAYLRLCEEPRGASRIFLIAEDEGHLAPALFSRMENVTRWSTLRPSEMDSFIESQPVTEDVEARRLCAGRPGLYLAMLGKPEYAELYSHAVRRLDGTDSSCVLSAPDAVRALKSGRSPERDAVALVCRKAALSLAGHVGHAGLHFRIRCLLAFSSLLTKVPSTNAEIHWQSTVLWAPM
ncbi:hypothetical protein LCGC14_2358350 [marine sediment metagenome]|uniref:Uncharacterized protein n=1 Tax=marine sediment metagenome TaxID=412755 RepID=A0A0F9F270_9ZZZZ